MCALLLFLSLFENGAIGLCICLSNLSFFQNWVEWD